MNSVIASPPSPGSPGLPGSPVSPMDMLNRAFPQAVVDLPSGAQVSVRQRGKPGQGPSVVLLHGISSGAASWLYTVLAMGDDVHVVAWNAPGYGASTPLAMDTPAATDYAASLHALLQALHIERCLLVGHSLGALMASAYARGLGAHVVEQLVLISPAGGYGAATQAEARERVRAQRRDALQTLGVAGIAQGIDQRLLSAAAPEEARLWVRWNAAQLRPAGYLQAVELLCHAQLDAGPALLMPVQVFCGDADVVTPPQACAAWAARLAAPFALIPGAGHASPSEQPTHVARLITRAAHHNPTRANSHG